ncbi:MAG: L-2-hydroxyglutarate oxidase [Ignavibacteriales bacterium]|nr:L-2-hydroxyglutarate oxidase [Ignavibacteriales bacterium]
MKYNFIIVGAGIVGLATAINLLKNNNKLKILVLEKEKVLGKHQSGNNSGVIHSGIYYKPESAKAENCKRGYKLLIDYCNKNEISYKLCGKLIVAVSPSEENTLLNIYDRGLKNGLKDLKILNNHEIKEIEPNVIGNKAIFVPSAGIIDFNNVLKKYAEEIKNNGTKIIFNSKVNKIIEKNDLVEVITNSETYQSDFLITCAGLQSDRIAKETEKKLDVKIVPFRGEYYKLKDDKKDLVNNLVYPVPDPSFPFLGVHFTKKIDGSVEAGPNAVLAFDREGYSKFSFNFKDTIETFFWPGFQKVAIKYWKTGIGEFYRSYNNGAFVRALQKLVPNIKSEDLVVGGAGVRAQACDINGNLLDDFKFVKSKRILHVCNAPSPAATASLSIGEKIAAMFLN